LETNLVAAFTCVFAAGAFDAGLETATGLETVTGLV